MNGGSFMKAAFEKIYDNYHQDLYQFIFYMVKDRHLTEDLVQEVYIRVLQSYESFEGKSSEKTWLFSIARFTTIDYFRSQKRRRNRILDFFDWGNKGEAIADQLPLPDDIIIRDEQLKHIYDCLDHCTIDQKSVIILRFLQSHSIEETAEILDFSISKVKTTQHRALKAMRKLLANNERKETRTLP